MFSRAGIFIFLRLVYSYYHYHFYHHCHMHTCMYAYIYIYIHVYIYAYAHTHTHTRIHVHIHTYSYTCIPIHTHRYTFYFIYFILFLAEPRSRCLFRIHSLCTGYMNSTNRCFLLGKTYISIGDIGVVCLQEFLIFGLSICGEIRVISNDIICKSRVYEE